MRTLAALLLALAALPAAVWWHDEGPLGAAFYVESPEGEFAFALPEDAQGTPTRRGLAGDTGWVTLPGGRALGLSWDGGPTWIRLEVAGEFLRQCFRGCAFGGEEGWEEISLPRTGLAPLGLAEGTLVARGRDSLWLLPTAGGGSVRSLSEGEMAAEAWLAAGDEIVLAPAPPAPTEGDWFPWGIAVEVEVGGANAVVVLGTVLRPGHREEGARLTLMEAVAGAMPRQNADLSRVEVRRADGSWQVMNLFPVLTGEERPFALAGQLALLVPAAPSDSVHVLGAVGRAGPVAWEEGMTVATAIAAAGGLGAEASTEALLAPVADESREIRLAAGHPDWGVALEAADAILVPTAGRPPLQAWDINMVGLLVSVLSPVQADSLLGG